MTQDKELLLKDLCARLPYGVKVQMADGPIEELLNVNVSTFICNGLRGLPKPYLFPLSSMTEEQKKTLKVMCDWNDEEVDAQSILVLYQKHFVMKTDVID